MKNGIKILFPRNKKGFNDISIMAVILSIFFLTSIMIAFVNSEFNASFSTLDTDGVTQKVKNDAESVSTISAFTVLKNIMLLALFDFGDTLRLPFWLDLVYSLLAIIFILVVARNIWVGGGA